MFMMAERREQIKPPSETWIIKKDVQRVNLRTRGSVVSEFVLIRFPVAGTEYRNETWKQTRTGSSFYSREEEHDSSTFVRSEEDGQTVKFFYIQEEELFPYEASFIDRRSKPADIRSCM